MRDQLDLDKGGIYRAEEKVYLGPSVGWVHRNSKSILEIHSPGVAVIERGITLIKVFEPGVTVQLPSAKGLAEPVTIPGTWPLEGVRVVAMTDQVSSAAAITILPAVGETISSLPSVRIMNPYGSVSLEPNLKAGGWTVTI